MLFLKCLYALKEWLVVLIMTVNGLFILSLNLMLFFYYLPLCIVLTYGCRP